MDMTGETIVSTEVIVKSDPSSMKCVKAVVVISVRNQWPVRITNTNTNVHIVIQAARRYRLRFIFIHDGFDFVKQCFCKGFVDFLSMDGFLINLTNAIHLINVDQIGRASCRESEYRPVRAR